MIFGNLGKMAEMVKQAKALKDEMSRARYEAEGSGVWAVVNGEMEILELKIAPEAKENTVKDIVNKAIRSAKAEAAKSLQKMTGGMSLPGMP